MKTRHIVILMLIMLVLVAGVWLKKSRVPEEWATEEFSTLNIEIDPVVVDQLTLAKGTGEPAITLQKTEQGWVSPAAWNLPVGEQKIKDAMDMLNGLKGELRGNAGELFQDFGIDDDEAFRITFKQGEEVKLALLFGTSQVRFGSTFIRFKDAEEVYLVDYNLFMKFGINTSSAPPFNEKFWLDMRIAEFDPATVTGAILEKTMGSQIKPVLALTKTTDEATGRGRWAFQAGDLPFGVDAGEVTSYLTEIKGLSASDYKDPDETIYGFESFYARWTFSTADGNTRQIVLGAVSDEASGSRFLKSDFFAPVFVLSKYSADKLDIDPSRFFSKNVLGIDEQQTVSITVHSGAEERTVTREAFEEQKALVEQWKKFTVARMLTPAEAKSVQAGKEERWISVKPAEGEPLIVDVGKPLNEEGKEYPVTLRSGTSRPFAISEQTYKLFF